MRVFHTSEKICQLRYERVNKNKSCQVVVPLMKIAKWASKNVPEPILYFLRPVYREVRRIRDSAFALLDSLGVVGPDAIYGEDYYAKRRHDPWRSDSRAVGSAINEYFEPDSVVDFGCAIGAHLELFYENEVTIKGVEGNSKAFDHAVVPQKFLEEHDLRNRYEPEREYDLALCFEVAEHIPERYADTLVATLVEAGDTIVMTAATPGQDGTHHVNEQPREYWYEKFNSHGYEYDQETVDDLSDKIVVEQSTWIPENLMVFRNSASLDLE